MLPFFSFLILTKARTRVIGIIASVLVSFTIVAESSTVEPVPCIESHVEAAAVTDEVSFTAVPAKSAKPSLLIPRKPPSVGKIRAAITLKRKITEIDCAISSSSASITGAVAAIAEPPQMLEPTPISVAVFDGTFKSLYITKATIK